MSSFAWAIDFSTFPEDTKKHLTEWCERTAVRSGLDEGRLFFVRKKKEKRAALYHNLRSLTRNWGAELPEGQDWLHQVDIIGKAEEENTIAPTSPEAAKAPAPTPTPADMSASIRTPDVYKSLLPPNYGEMVAAMLSTKVAA